MNLLLVEDDNGIGQVLTRGLKAAGHPVDWVVHGWEAIERISVFSYDAVILDLMLPDMDGMDVCTRLRGLNCQLPILILSARDRLEQRVKGLDAGADDYMTKPFAFEELMARLRALCRRTSSVDVERQLAAGGIILNLDSHDVRVEGRQVELTLREFCLLEYLMRNKNKVVSRTSILNNVWGVGADVNVNTVDVYIGYLRKKLDLSDRITTMRGIGFKLIL